MDKNLAVFEGHEIRRVYDEKTSHFQLWWWLFPKLRRELFHGYARLLDKSGHS